MKTKTEQMDSLLNVIRVWIETESGPTCSTFTLPDLSVTIAIRGYKRITLTRSFPKSA